MTLDATATGRRTPLRSLFALAFFVALVFASTMAFLPHPPSVMGNMWDKEQHMLAFATLTFLACFGFPEMPLPRIAERLSFIGALIEVVQSYPPLHRDCDIFDWMADTVAVILMAVVVGIISRLRRPREPSALR